MTFVPAVAGNFKSRVSDSVRLSDRYFLLRIRRPQGMPEPAAGQFLQLGVPDGGRFFLRRPFSVFDCDDRTLDLLIVEVGPGTRAIRRLCIGDESLLGDCRADVLIANILAAPLIELAPRLAEAVRPGGQIALSGLLLEQAGPVATAYRAWFDIGTAEVRDGWALLGGPRRSS